MPNGPFHTLAVIAALSLLPLSVAAKRVPQHVDKSHWVHDHRKVEPTPIKSRRAKPEPKPREKLAKAKQPKGHARHEEVEARVERPHRRHGAVVEVEEKPHRRHGRNPEVVESKREERGEQVAEKRRPTLKYEDPAPKTETSIVAVGDSLTVAAPVSVVSVVRQTTEHPSLESASEVASTPQIMPQLYDSGGRLNVLPAMRGTHDILVRQNVMADLDGLTRIQDDDDLARMREKKMLVAIPVNDGLRIDERLPVNRRFCRPWVAHFLLSLGQAHYAQFHTPLQINSAVRTVSFQLRLIRTNGNAAPAAGEDASPHLTGQAVDIAKKGLSQAEIAWMRLYLTPLQEDGKLDVEEEFQQACFHVSIYKKFSPIVPGATKIAVTHRNVTPSSISLDSLE